MPRRYAPPILDRRVRLRNPEDEPQVARDDLNRPINPIPEWGAEVYANRRDQRPYTEIDEGVLIRGGITVFTIYHRAGVGPDTYVVDEEGIEYIQTGSPIERGGTNGYMLQKYLELHTERKTAQETQ